MTLMISDVQGVKVVTFQTLAIVDPVEIDTIGEQLYELVDGQAKRKILLDFARVRQLSSQMLGALIKLNNKSKGIKGKVILCGLRPDLMKAFEVTRLNKVLTIVADEARREGTLMALAAARGGLRGHVKWRVGMATRLKSETRNSKSETNLKH